MRIVAIVLLGLALLAGSIAVISQENAFAAGQNEVIATGINGAPGAIVCPDFRSVQQAIRAYAPQPGAFPGIPRVPPGCAVVPPGTLMTQEGADAGGSPVVSAVLPDGRTVRGVTLHSMIGSFARARPASVAPKAERRAVPKPQLPKVEEPKAAASHVGPTTYMGNTTFIFPVPPINEDAAANVDPRGFVTAHIPNVGGPSTALEHQVTSTSLSLPEDNRLDRDAQASLSETLSHDNNVVVPYRPDPNLSQKVSPLQGRYDEAAYELHCAKRDTSSYSAFKKSMDGDKFSKVYTDVKELFPDGRDAGIAMNHLMRVNRRVFGESDQDYCERNSKYFSTAEAAVAATVAQSNEIAPIKQPEAIASPSSEADSHPEKSDTAGGSVPEAEAEVIACVHRAMRDGAVGSDAIVKVCEGYYREYMWACQMDINHRGYTYENGKTACAWGLAVAQNEAEHGRR